MIKISNLNKYYNKGKTSEFHALKDVSLEIEKGELLAVIGKSGAGKSTLLHILGAIDRYDSGSYVFDGIDVGALRAGKLASFRNEHVGIVLQDFALLEGLSVLENVMLPLRFSKKPFRVYKKLALAALREVELEDLAGKSVNQLSGGQKQRVAIARAIVNDPSLLLADEPTGALDTKTTEQIIELFRRLNQKGKTILLITHDPQVAACCSRIIEISDGQLLPEPALG